MDNKWTRQSTYLTRTVHANNVFKNKITILKQKETAFITNKHVLHSTILVIQIT
jgi:hypothetical protein